MSEYTEEQKVKDYGFLFNTETGRRVLEDLMLEHHIMQPNPPTLPSEGCRFRDGERNVIFRILTMLNFDPDLFIETTKEISNG